MMKRIVALCLTGAALVSLSAPALAVRANSSSTPISATGSTSVTIPSDGTLTFDQIGPRVKANNLNLKAAQESLKSAQAMDWDEAIDDMEEAIDNIDISIAVLTSKSAASIAEGNTALAAVGSGLNVTGEKFGELKIDGFDSEKLAKAISAISAGTYLSLQAASLDDTLESMEDQLDDLKEQKEDYQKTLADTERQIDYTADQLVSGAESLYLTILSTQLQLEALKDTQKSTQRTLQEMELRYSLGQISQLTLTQVRNGCDSLDASLLSMENALTTLYSSLQSLMGDTPTGQLRLLDTPTVTDQQIAGLSYDADLEKAKEKSYTLYTAQRTVEDAEDAMNDARRDEGKNSYQFKMAEYTYQSSLYQQDAAVADFELSFLNLYRAIPPAQAALAAKEVDLAYQEQTYAVAQKKYELGNLSANELQDAQDTLNTAQRDVEAARLDLFTAYHSYRQAVDLGLVSSSS